jgi:hypothetical protein
MRSFLLYDECNIKRGRGVLWDERNVTVQLDGRAPFNVELVAKDTAGRPEQVNGFRTVWLDDDGLPESQPQQQRSPGGRGEGRRSGVRVLWYGELKASGGTGSSDELRWFARAGETVTIGLNGELWRGRVSRSPDGTLQIDDARKIGGYGDARVVTLTREQADRLSKDGGAGGLGSLRMLTPIDSLRASSSTGNDEP